MRILFLAGLSAAAVWGQGCDRACLGGFVTQYLNAMVAHNPGALPVAGNVRFTEDTVALKLGEGLWKTASKIRPYRLDMLDVRQGVAASHVIVEEAGEPLMFVLRMRVAGGKITEVETQVTRKTDGRLFTIDSLQTPRREMTLVPEPSQRASREEAIRIAQFYPAGLKIGSFVEVDAPFTKDAYRIENGGAMAGPGCSRPPGCLDIKAQTIIKHPAITTRVAAVDEELGIVLLRMNFGDTGSYGAGNALIVWEAFKIYGGQIHAVEAFMKVMPATAPSGWD